jgi:hypothetical protein
VPVRLVMCCRLNYHLMTSYSSRNCPARMKIYICIIYTILVTVYTLYTFFSVMIVIVIVVINIAMVIINITVIIIRIINSPRLASSTTSCTRCGRPGQTWSTLMRRTSWTLWRTTGTGTSHRYPPVLPAPPWSFSRRIRRLPAIPLPRTD